MYYESFLFTRSQRRDFTAFVRPKDLTNREISTIASALNYVTDIALVSPDFPSLYCFPIGAYVLLLRHYNSGRTHAGREIGVIEGIAVRRTRARHFALALPHILAHSDELLAVADQAGDLEALTMETSLEKEWDEVEALGAAPDEFVTEFVARQADNRLFVPFSARGRGMLLAALSDKRFPSLYFAFGTNADVLGRLHTAGIDVDIVSYFNTTQPSFRSRATNEKSGDIAGYTDETPTRAVRPRREIPSQEKPVAVEGKNPETDYNRQQTVAPKTQPVIEESTTPGRPTIPLTPREMRREMLKQQQDRQVRQKSWLSSLLSRLFGR